MIIAGLLLMLAGIALGLYGHHVAQDWLVEIKDILESGTVTLGTVFLGLGILLTAAGAVLLIVGCVKKYRNANADAAKSSNSLYKVTISAIMIALGTVLSLVKVWQMPMGGSITLLSMLPVCMIGILYGTPTAIVPCVLYGFLQMMIDGVFGWGLTAGTLVGSIVFDYLVAFGALSLAGLFRKKGTAGILGGVALAVTVRFFSHLLSGCIFFRSFEMFNNPFVYSLVYNGTYMLPELILTVLGAFLLARANFYEKMSVLVARAQR